MSHYAVIAPALYSHFQALQALAGVLIDRGHRVTFVHQQEARTLVHDARIGFEPVGLHTHPAGSLARSHRLAAHPTGLSIRRLIADMATTTDMLCRELPSALERLGVDGIIADQMEAFIDIAGGDGFMLSPIYCPGAIEEFVDLVVPELQRRNLFRADYSGVTQRDHLMQDD